MTNSSSKSLDSLESSKSKKTSKSKAVKAKETAHKESVPAEESVPKKAKQVKAVYNDKGYQTNHAMKADPKFGMAKPSSMRGVKATDDDLRKFNAINKELFNLQDIDLSDADQVRERISWYFELHERYAVRPTVAGLAMCLNGMSRSYLWSVVNDKPIGSCGARCKIAPASVDEIKKAYKNMEIMWEFLFNQGKINPVTGIFMAKNNYGYKDQTEHVIAPTINSSETMTVEDIKERYAIDYKNDSENE